MKTSCLILLISISISFAQAQFVEDFSSGNVLNTAIWQGSTAFFKINTANQLQSNGPLQRLPCR